MATDNKDTSVLESLKKYKPSNAMVVRKDEVVTELEKLLGGTAAVTPPETQPATPDQVLAPPPANNQPPQQPEVDEATATAAEAKELSARLVKAVTAFDTAIVEEISFTRPKYKQNTYIAEEAARLAGFLDTMVGRATRQTKALEVTFRGAKQTVSTADKTGVVITITTGANKSPVQLPWGQILSDTLWEIVKPLVKEDKDEYVNLGLMFFYREQPVYARWAWSHAMTLGADVKPYVDRLATVPAPKEGTPATPPSGEVKPPDKTMETVPKKIIFEGDGVRNYVKNAKGTWQTGEKYMIVSGSASAELACGDVKGFSVKFRARETPVKAMFGLGPWKIGLDGNDGKAVVQHADKSEKRVPETVSAGPEYTLAIEPSPEGKIYTVNGKVIEKSDDKKAQPGPLVIEVEGKLGIDLLEIQFLE